jgi:hypothetical protein
MKLKSMNNLCSTADSRIPARKTSFFQANAVCSPVYGQLFLFRKEFARMPNQQTTLLIEIPADVAQEEVWDAEERLRQVEGVKTELQEPRDVIAATLLFLHVAAPYLGQIAAIGGGIKATHDIAKIIYDFLHPAGKAKTNARGKNKVVIVKKGKRIELYNLSTEEIEKVLEEQ